MVNDSILSILAQNSNQGPMFEETNGKFARNHSEGTEKEHCIYNGKILQITLKFNISRIVKEIMALQFEEI